MSYPVEVRLASKNGWFTPAEGKKYYGKYSRAGVTWHWWGGGEPASKHDSLVNYFLNQSAAGKKSVNFVLSDNKITMVVSPENVAWTSQGGNATTVSVELQPTLSAEGYKKAGWLKMHLEQNYGVGEVNYPHNYWFSTQCPGTISIDRIQQEYVKWKSGAYNPAPPVPSPDPVARLEWIRWKEGTITYVTNKQPTKLWNFNQTKWSGFGNGVKDFNKGEQVQIVGEVNNLTLGSKYLLTAYSFDNKITNGFNAADMDVYVPPRPIPEPPVEPPDVPPPYKPEWEANLRDIDNTKYWILEDTPLVDITTGLPTGTKTFKKDEEFEVSALTMSNGVEYRITEYSFKKGIFNGVPISKLTLTPPGVPDVPPVPDYPKENNNLLKIIIELLQKIIGLLTK